ncbi:MAG: endonuclease domain-containing protein [Ignavibacteria bacterium]
MQVPSLQRRGFRGGLNTGKIYNRQQDNEKRKKLRNNMTKAEAILWRELKSKKILGFKFRRQFGIGAYVVDFYCTELKLIIEVDGVTHCTDEEKEYDSRRESEIEQLDIKFLRFTNPEIYDDLYNVLEKIKAKVEELKIP